MSLVIVRKHNQHDRADKYKRDYDHLVVRGGHGERDRTGQDEMISVNNRLRMNIFYDDET